SPKVCSDQSSGSGTGKGISGYLPTLNEDEEWKCDQDAEEDNGRDSGAPSRLTQKLLLETATTRASSSRRYSEGREFRDGVPPYRTRKQHRREMQESVQVNGRVPLPHIPRTYRMPKEIRVEPQKFAEELIHRLEAVQRTREAEEKLEERLKRVRM
uniref:Axin 1 n=1 Tax=Cavia porcellus TaxID=10141 RepID=A0A286XIJ7_CAVPO